MLKSGLFLSASNVATALLALARNILVARLVSIEDFGIAATFAAMMAMVEMLSYMGIDQILIQSEDGDAPELQATAHTFQAVRGLLGAVLLLVLAAPIANLFNVPHAAWAYQLLALVPLFRGLAHLDPFRAQRQMRFGPIVAVEFTAIAASTLAVFPLGPWLQDYRVMLIAILLQQVLVTLISHLVSQRPYRWGWDRKVSRRIVRFGWPLLTNGLLMFVIFQGDRIVVGSQIGMTELGWFSAAFALTLTPTLVVAKTLSSFFLPQLSNAQKDQATFQQLYLAAVQAGFLSGVGLAVFFATVGPPLFILLYGVKYNAALPVLIWLAIMQALRISKAGPAIVATSRAETTNPLIANILRTSMLPVTWIAAQQGGGVLAVVALALVGEALALTASLFLLKRRLALPLASLLLPATTCIATIGWAGTENYLLSSQDHSFRLGQVFVVASLPLVFWSMHALRGWVWSLLVTTHGRAGAASTKTTTHDR